MEPKSKFNSLIVIIFVGFSTLYFSAFRMIVGPNDGGHFALTSSIAVDKRFQIQNFSSHTRHIDYAFHDGNFYSDRPIGLSIVSLPAFWLAELISGNDNNREFNQKISVAVTQSIIGSLGVITLILIMLQLGSNFSPAVITGIVYGISSLHFKYSSIYMAHALSVTCFLVAIFLVNSDTFFKKPFKEYLFFFLLGFLPLTRYEVAVLIPVLLSLLVLKYKREKISCNLVKVFLLTSYALLPLLILGFYHTVCFGSPLETYAKYYSPHDNYWLTIKEHNQGGGFTIPNMHTNKFIEGLKLIYFGIPNAMAAWGLIVLQPILIYALPGIRHGLKEDRAKSVIFLFAIFILTYVSAKNLSISGGAMRDPRYMLPVLPLFFIFIGLYLSNREKNKFDSLEIFPFILLSATSCLFCAIHLIETDNNFFNWADLNLKYKQDSLISFVSLKVIIKTLLPSIDLFYIGAISSGLFCGIIYASRKLFSESTFRGSTSTKLLIPVINLSLIILIIYCLKNPHNLFNTFEDTLKISDMRVVHAAQENDFPYFNVSSNRKPAAFVDGKPCEGGLVTKARSSFVFYSREDSFKLNFSVGLSDQNIWLNTIDSAETSYMIKVNDLEVWHSKSVTRKSPSDKGSIVIPANAKVELLTLAEYNKDVIKSIWCNATSL